MSAANLYEVIRAPRVSEKTARLQEVSNQYVFEVAKTATKADVKAAVEKIFDVKVKATVVERKEIAPWRWRSSMSYLLTNARSQPVTLDLRQRGLDWYWAETKVITESQKSERLDADGVQWRVTVPANGETTITATFETRY